MPNILTLALRVVVHLGQELNRSDLALKLIEKIGKTNYSAVPSTNLHPSSFASFGFPPAGSRKWTALRKFWGRQWFRREGDWTVFLAASTKICDFGLIYDLGNSYTNTFAQDQANTSLLVMLKLCEFRAEANPATHFKFMCKKYLELHETILEEEDGLNMPEFRPMSIMRQDPGMAEIFLEFLDKQTINGNYGFSGNSSAPAHSTRFPGHSLLSLIDFTRAAEATKPRDRLFALLRLADDLDTEERQQLETTYNEDLYQVLYRYASVLLKKGQYIEVLYSSAPKPAGSMIEIPYWLCDWSMPIPTLTTNTVPLGTINSGIYNAGGTSAANFCIGNPNDVLVVSGGLVNTIERLATASVFDRSWGPLQAIESSMALTEIDLIFEDLSSYPTGESLFEVKWRTLIANKTSTATEAPAQYGEQYMALREDIGSIYTTFSQQEMSDSTPKRYTMALCLLAFYKLCRTRGGYVRLVPLHAENGDQISIFKGGRVPFVLRPSTEREGIFKLIGGCYIHGLMKGEAFELPHWQDTDLYLH